MRVKIGDVFEKWVVIDGPFYEPHGKRKRWHCLCECFAESLVHDYDLKSGRSVGCRACGSSRAWYNSDSSKLRRYPHVSLQVYEKVTGAADNAIARCRNPENARYQDWGGRGIEVKFSNREEFVDYLLTLPGFDNFNFVLFLLSGD